MLAIGELLGNPWFGVLLSSALLAAVLYWALRAWIPTRWAFLAALLAICKLCVTSYWVNSYWGGVPAAIGGALAIGGLGRVFRRCTPGGAIALGVGLSILANSRPYEGLFFSIPVVAILLWWLTGKTKRTIPLPSRIKSEIRSPSGELRSQ